MLSRLLAYCLKLQVRSNCCSFLVQPFTGFLAGTTDTNGKLVIPAGIPAGVPLGIDVYLQGALPDLGSPIFTNGLQLHIGLK